VVRERKNISGTVKYISLVENGPKDHKKVVAGSAYILYLTKAVSSSSQTHAKSESLKLHQTCRVKYIQEGQITFSSIT